METTGLQPWSQKQHAFLYIFLGTDEEDAEHIGYTPQHMYKGDDWISDYADAHARIQAWFERGKKEGIRAWNAKFDRAFAEVAGFDIPGDGMWYDGMLVAHAINERRSNALKAVAKDLFGEGADDDQKKVKDWLNGENRRRASLLKDAIKAEAGMLKIKFVEAKCDECGEKWTSDVATLIGEVCPHCAHVHAEPTVKNRTRAATPEEAQAVIDEAAKYTLPDGDYERCNYSDVPMSIMGPYGLEDVILTRRISDIYDVTLEANEDLAGVVEFERRAMDALYAIEKRGLPARIEEYRKLEQEVLRNLDRLSDEVDDLVLKGDPGVYAKELGKKVEVSEDGRIVSVEKGGALREFNPNSSMQIIAALKARGADLSFMSEKNGKLAADAENLRAVDDELAAKILEYRSENKVLTTYVRPMIGRSYESMLNTHKEPFIAPDSRIHANYRQVGARTGRMSCSDPNMQNQPRDDLRLRYNIVADPGFALITCDLTNIEMVLFSAYCGEGKLLSAVQAGEDLHTLTAQMLGLKDRPRPGGGIETARQLGKTYNFSRIYGGGLRTIKRSFRCSMDEARLLKSRFDRAYPEVGRLQNRIEYKLQDDGYVQDRLISGRRFRVDPRDAYKAPNYLIQGTAASLLKLAVSALHEDGVPMVALVHDEVVAHVPVDEAQEVAALIEKRMTTTAPKMLTDLVPIRAEADIVGRWSDAKPLKDPEGRAYFFDPEWADVPRRYVDEQEAVA